MVNSSPLLQPPKKPGWCWEGLRHGAAASPRSAPRAGVSPKCKPPDGQSRRVRVRSRMGPGTGPDMGLAPYSSSELLHPPLAANPRGFCLWDRGHKGIPHPNHPHFGIHAPSWVWDHVTRARRLLPSVGWAAGVPTLGSTASHPHPATRIGARRGLVALRTPVSIVQGREDCIMQVLRGAGPQIPRAGNRRGVAPGNPAGVHPLFGEESQLNHPCGEGKRCERGPPELPGQVCCRRGHGGSSPWGGRARPSTLEQPHGLFVGQTSQLVALGNKWFSLKKVVLGLGLV